MVDFTETEVDALVKADEELVNNKNKRGRAYHRYQRRNHIKKRAKQAIKTGWYLDFHATEEINKVDKGIMGKTHIGCNKKRCLLCNYSKIFGFDTLKDIKFKDKMKAELEDYYADAS